MTFKALTLSILFFISFGIVSGQDSVYVFKVKKPKSILSISFQDSILIKGEKYLFKIKVIKGKRIVSKVFSDSLKIKKVGVDLFSISIPRKTIISKAMLKIYLKKEDGTVYLEQLKTYKIVEPEKPVIFVGDVKADSVIDKRYLYDYAKLHAVYQGLTIRVLSFELVTFANGTENKFVSYNNSLTISMKQHIQKLKIGSAIYFNKVNCLLPNGKTRKVETVRLFFDETDKYKVGVRIMGLKK